MQDEEIRQKIASFPRWHYQFDLRGNLTPIHKKPRVNRHTQREKHFFDPLVRLFGGSLEGKRVLDLASNAGYWSLASIEAGADYVLGIEGRQMHVDQASLVVDTTLSMARGSFLKIVPQDPDSYMSAVDRSIAMRPTKRAVRALAEHFGYSVVTLEPDFRNAKGKPAWAGSNDYRRGSRRAFICAKKTDLSHLSAKVESA